jgi:hypothetical protein
MNQDSLKTSEIIEKATLEFPYERIVAEISFSKKAAEIMGIDLFEAFYNYSDFYGTIFDKKYDEVKASGDFIKLKEISKLPTDQFAAEAYKIYIASPHNLYEEGWTPNGTKRFGAIGFDFSDYNKEKNQIKTHFLPSRKGNVSDLSSEKLQERRKDFKQALEYVHSHPEEYQGAKHITSFSWLHNLPNYRALFPQKTIDRLKPSPADKMSYKGFWGQFSKWTGEGNKQSLEKLLENLNKLPKTASLEDLVNCLPFRVLEGKWTLEEFYEEYEI